MSGWKSLYQSITDCVIVSSGVNSLSNEKYSNSSCGCAPKYAGEVLCRDHRCINFATQTECVRCRDGCANKRITNRQYAKLEVLETPGKGYGLFTMEDLKKQQFLMEYVGELISQEEFQRRCIERDRLMEHQYIMQLKNGVYLDAGRKGSISRFINHSCEPNCYVEVWNVQGHLRVGIFSMCSIPAGTELSFDYQWRPSTRPPTKCHCGTSSCRGYLEVLTREEKEALKIRRGVWRKGGESLARSVSPRPPSAFSSETSVTPEGSEEHLDVHTVSPESTPALPTTDAVVVDIYNESGLLIPSRLIGKRVKIWWEGNLSYLEADVESYNPKTNKYLCRYPMDGSTSEEDFGRSVGSLSALHKCLALASSSSSTNSATSVGNSDPIIFSAETLGSSDSTAPPAGAQWFWLDETVEETIIRKKASDVLLGDYEAVNQEEGDSFDRATAQGERNKDNSTSDGNGNASSVTLIERAVVTITTSMAHAIADQFNSESSMAEGGCAFISQPHYNAWQNVQQIFSVNYGIRMKYLPVDDNQISAGADSSAGKPLVLYGSAEKMKDVLEIIRLAEVKPCTQDASAVQKAIKALLNRQGVILTQDWRFQPELPGVNSESKTVSLSSAGTSFDSYVVQHLAGIPVLDGVLPVQDLPTGITAISKFGGHGGLSCLGPASNQAFDATEVVRRALLSHLHSLTTRLGFSTQTSVHAHMLLVRYLRFVPTLVVKDSLPLLAAVVTLAAKCCANFKYKTVQSIVHSAYCQVFSRLEGEIEQSSVQPYLESCIEREGIIFEKLQKDVFSADIVPVLHSFLRRGMHSEKWLFENDALLNHMIVEMPLSEGKDKHRDREAEHAKRKKIATFQYESTIRNTVCRSIISAGECLAQELLCLGQSSSGGVVEISSGSALVLCSIPVELVQTSCVVLVCLLYGYLPSSTQHRRLSSEVNKLLLDLTTWLVRMLNLSTTALQWCVTLVVEACIEFLPSLDFIEPIRELRESFSAVKLVELLRATLPPRLEEVLQQSMTVIDTVAPNAVTGASASVGTDQVRSSLKPPSIAGGQAPGPCKSRFPWLSSSHVDPERDPSNAFDKSALYLEKDVSLSDFHEGKYRRKDDISNAELDEAPVLACAKDLYFALAAINTDPAKFLPRLFSDSEGDKSCMVDVGLMSLRPFPTKKYLEKEVGRSGVQSVRQLGPISACLRELFVLQHLHYFYHPSNSDCSSAGPPGECPHFIAPVGVLTLTSGDFVRNLSLRATILGDANPTVCATGPEELSQMKSLGRTGLITAPVHYPDLQFLAFPSVHVSLTGLLGLNTPSSSPRWDLTRSSLQNYPEGGLLLERLSENKGHLLPAVFAVELLRDLLCAVDHMISCGVLLRWLNTDDMYLTSGGRLQIGGLSGAVMASYSTSSVCNTSSGVLLGTTRSAAAVDSVPSSSRLVLEDSFSIAALSEALTAQKNGHSKVARSTSKTHKHQKHRAHKRKFSLNPFDDDDDDYNSSSVDTGLNKMRNLARKLNLPRSTLYTVAPEVLLGAEASPESTMYTAASVAVQLLTGKPLIKNASSEEKQVQYTFRTLGTPKTMGYAEFDCLPLAGLYGRSIVDEDDRRSESRSRSHKLLRELCPPPLLALYSFKTPQAATASAAGPGKAGLNLYSVEKSLQAQGESDHKGVLDLLRESMQLVPHRRLLPNVLLQFSLFHRPVSALSAEVNAMCSDKNSKSANVNFQTDTYFHSSGELCNFTCLNAKESIDMMEETVRFMRTIQAICIPDFIAKKEAGYTSTPHDQLAKWTVLDAVLFREERAKLPQIQFNNSSLRTNSAVNTQSSCGGFQHQRQQSVYLQQSAMHQQKQVVTPGLMESTGANMFLPQAPQLQSPQSSVNGPVVHGQQQIGMPMPRPAYPILPNNNFHRPL